MGNYSDKPMQSAVSMKPKKIQERSCLESPAMMMLIRALRIQTRKLKAVNRRMFGHKDDDLEADRILRFEDEDLEPSNMKLLIICK